MRAIDRRIQAQPLVPDLVLQRFDQPLPLLLLRPSVEAIEHGFPGPELLGQITPRNSRPKPPKHCLHEPPVIVCGAPSPSLARQEVRYSPPLLLFKPMSNHRLPDGTHIASDGNSVQSAQYFPLHTERILGTGPSGTGRSPQFRRALPRTPIAASPLPLRGAGTQSPTIRPRSEPSLRTRGRPRMQGFHPI